MICAAISHYLLSSKPFTIIAFFDSSSRLFLLLLHTRLPYGHQTTPIPPGQNCPYGYLKTCRPMDCSVHTAASQKGTIGSINNRLNICDFCNIAFYRFYQIHFIHRPFCRPTIENTLCEPSIVMNLKNGKENYSLPFFILFLLCSFSESFLFMLLFFPAFRFL